VSMQGVIAILRIVAAAILSETGLRLNMACVCPMQEP
jgi:hypothetical protein